MRFAVKPIKNYDVCLTVLKNMNNLIFDSYKKAFKNITGKRLPNRVTGNMDTIQAIDMWLNNPNLSESDITQVDLWVKYLFHTSQLLLCTNRILLSYI